MPGQKAKKQKKSKPIFTSLSDEWGTPQDHFNEWDEEFNFTLDPCGIKSRPLKEDMVTLDIRDGQDGLKQDWGGGRGFINPPYSGNNIKLWYQKIFEEKNKAELIVLLIPLSKGSTNSFHDLIYPFVSEIRMIRQRLKFHPLQGQANTSNPQGSMLIVIRKSDKELI